MQCFHIVLYRWEWSCLLRPCHHQGIVYNGDADDQDLGKNDEDENFPVTILKTLLQLL